MTHRMFRSFAFAACIAMSGMSALAQDNKPADRKPQPVPAAKPAAKPEAKPAAQPADKGAAPDPMMEAYMKAGTPGENHKIFEKFVGHWEGTVKMWQQPGATPEEMKTTCTHKIEFGGRYLYSHFSGPDPMGGEFKGVGVMGYNNVLKIYQSSWIDNMSTGVESSTGKYDAATRSFTFTGEMTDPISNGTKKGREVIKLTSDDTCVHEFFTPGPDGKEFKNMEITLSRKGKGDEHGKGHDKEDKEKGKGKGNK